MATTTTETPASQLAGALEHLLTGVMDTVTREGTIVKIVAGGLPFELVVLLGTADPLAHVKEGDHIDRDELRDHGDDVRCPETAPGRRRDQSGCSRKVGHPGQHIAWSTRNGGTAMVVWGGATAATTDPLAHIGRNDTLRPDQWPSEYRQARCHVNGPGGICTREPGHPGQHIATYSNGRVCGVWPADVEVDDDDDDDDPLADVVIHDQDPTDGPDELDPCGYDIWGDECTRESGHPGQHIAGDGELVLDRCPQ
jgi:hypothetical protein